MLSWLVVSFDRLDDRLQQPSYPSNLRKKRRFFSLRLVILVVHSLLFIHLFSRLLTPLHNTEDGIMALCTFVRTLIITSCPMFTGFTRGHCRLPDCHYHCIIGVPLAIISIDPRYLYHIVSSYPLYPSHGKLCLSLNTSTLTGIMIIVCIPCRILYFIFFGLYLYAAKSSSFVVN